MNVHLFGTEVNLLWFALPLLAALVILLVLGLRHEAARREEAGQRGGPTIPEGAAYVYASPDPSVIADQSGRILVVLAGC